MASFASLFQKITSSFSSTTRFTAAHWTTSSSNSPKNSWTEESIAQANMQESARSTPTQWVILGSRSRLRKVLADPRTKTKHRNVVRLLRLVYDEKDMNPYESPSRFANGSRRSRRQISYVGLIGTLLAFALPLSLIAFAIIDFVLETPEDKRQRLLW